MKTKLNFKGTTSFEDKVKNTINMLPEEMRKAPTAEAIVRAVLTAMEEDSARIQYLFDWLSGNVQKYTGEKDE